LKIEYFEISDKEKIKMKKILVLLPVLLLAVSAQAQTVRFTEDFESYLDTAEMVALNPLWDTCGPAISISTAQAHGGVQSLLVPNTRDLATAHWTPVTASVANPVVVSWSMYDTMDHGTYARNGGLSVGGYADGVWGTGALQNYVYVGPYHANGYATHNYRSVYGCGWQSGTVARTVGWHEIVMTLDGTEMTGTVDATETTVAGSKLATEPASGWSCFRAGSPATDSWQTAYYDDITVKGDTLAVDEWTLY